MECKYPNIKVKLSGQDGNVFNLMGLVVAAMKKRKAAPEDIATFRTEVFSSGNYDQALQVMMKYVNVR